MPRVSVSVSVNKLVYRGLTLTLTLTVTNITHITHNFSTRHHKERSPNCSEQTNILVAYTFAVCMLQLASTTTTAMRHCCRRYL